MKASAAEAFRIAVFPLGSDIGLDAFYRRISSIQSRVESLLRSMHLGSRLVYSLVEDDRYHWLKVSIRFSGQLGLLDDGAADAQHGELSRECDAALARLKAGSDILQELCNGTALSLITLDHILARRGFCLTEASPGMLPLGGRGLPLTPMIDDTASNVHDFELGQNPKFSTSNESFDVVLAIQMVGEDSARALVRSSGSPDLLRRRGSVRLDWARSGRDDHQIFSTLCEAIRRHSDVHACVHLRRHISGRIAGLLASAPPSLVSERCET